MIFFKRQRVFCSKIVIFTIALVAFTLTQSIMNINDKKPVAILLTGTGSSGKTSTTEAFKELCGDKYAIVNIDDFVDGKEWEAIRTGFAIEWGWDSNSKISFGEFIGNYLGQQNRENDRKKFVKALHDGQVRYIQDKALLGGNIVVDTVDPYVYDNLSTIVSDHACVKVLLYCPLSIIGQRFEKRNALNDPDEYRDFWTAFYAFPIAYKIQVTASASDTVVDRITYSDDFKQFLLDGIESVRKHHWSVHHSPEESAAFEDFYRDFLHILEEQKEVIVVAQKQYDLVINTGINLPGQAAKKIVDFCIL
jgi:chloramphenicol 3-O-phosphotransferase